MGNGYYKDQWYHYNKPDLAPYRSKLDRRFGRYEAGLKYLYDWKEEVESTPNLKKEERKARILSQQTFDAWERICLAIPAAIKYLLDQGQQYVMARIFCQDPLEQHFSKQRGAMGGNRNPTADQYLRNENKIHLQGSLSMKRRGTNTESIPSCLDSTPLPAKRKRPVSRAIFPK